MFVSRHVLGDESPGSHPLRIVQLTDVHLKRIRPQHERIAAAVHELAPDIVLLTGDMLDRRDRLPELQVFLSLLPEITTFATLGNWEHWSGVDQLALRQLYESFRVRLLVNESVLHEHSGRVVLITGLDDSTGGAPNLQRALQDADPAQNHLVLAHSPGYRDRFDHEMQAINDQRPVAVSSTALQHFAPDYMFSGHTHGGQINLLGWAPVVPPGSGRYVQGWYGEEAPFLYVSQGLGTSIVPVRLGAVPEISLFEWYLDS
jgi:hypothetical protein